MNIKPINRDVAVRIVKEEKKTSSGLVLAEKGDSSVKTFEVVAVSDKVTSVSVGDKVLISWDRITMPVSLDVNGTETRVGFTCEDEILGVLE